jgi:hypothetical protein
MYLKKIDLLKLIFFVYNLKLNNFTYYLFYSKKKNV